MAKLYIIKDIVADVVSLGPVAAINDGVMVRQITDMLSGGSKSANQYSTNPADYELWSVGEMDDKTGKIIELEQPVMLHRLNQLMPAKPIE